MAAPVLQFKRGLLANLPGLRAGEPGFTTDSYDLYVGIDSTSNNNKFFGSHRYWTKGTTTTGSGVNFVEGTNNGTDFITLKAPNSLAGIVTFVLPGTQGATSSVLTNDGSGNLSWASGSANPVFSGIATFTDTTDNTQGNADTGAVQIDGGLGINKNVTIGQNLYVAGYANFVGVVTFQGGTISIGDSITDNVNVAGEFISNLNPNTDATYNLGIATQRWNNFHFAGIGTIGTVASTNLQSTNINASGITTLTNATGTNINFSGVGTVTTLNTTNLVPTNINSSGVSTFTTISVTNDTGTNINKTGVGTITTLNVTNLLPTNINVSGASTFAQTITGTISTATRATTVDTTTTSTNASYYVPFVSNLTGTNGETIRVGAGISINPSTGNVGVSSVLSIGDSNAINSYIKAGGGSNAMYIYGNGNVSMQAKLIANNIRSSTDTNDAITLAGRNALFNNDIKVTGIATIGTGVGVTQFSGSVSTGTSTSSVPTSSAVIDYVGTQVANVDLTTGIAGDSGTGTVNTSQTLTVAGTSEQVTTSASNQTITLSLPSTVVVGTAVSAPTLKTAAITHRNGTSAVTIDTSGNVTASQNLTISGNLYVNGSTTQVNTTTATVEDRTIELGIVDGSAPSSTTTWDLGVLFNYYDGSAKKSALVWEQGDARFKLGSVISADADGSGNTNPQITFTTYAGLEIGSLWVNDCAGQSQVINCSGSTRTLENITVDCGSF